MSHFICIFNAFDLVPNAKTEISLLAKSYFSALFLNIKKKYRFILKFFSFFNVTICYTSFSTINLFQWKFLNILPPNLSHFFIILTLISFLSSYQLILKLLVFSVFYHNSYGFERQFLCISYLFLDYY